MVKTEIIYKFLSKERQSNGIEAYVVRRPGKKPVILNTKPGSRNFRSEYLTAFYSETDEEINAIHKEIRECLYTALKRARERANLSSVPCTISMDDLISMLVSQKGKCAISGMEFNYSKSSRSDRRPFAPSIDRINARKGYVVANVRLTTVIANVARSDFSDSEFHEMCLAVSNKMRPKTTPR